MPCSCTGPPDTQAPPRLLTATEGPVPHVPVPLHMLSHLPAMEGLQDRHWSPSVLTLPLGTPGLPNRVLLPGAHIRDPAILHRFSYKVPEG